MVKPIGGPNGYVYNIINDFDNSDILLETLNNSVVERVKKYRKFIPGFLVEFLKVIREEKNIKAVMSGNVVIPNINEYSIIHFHIPYHLFACRNALKNFHGKVVLTNHTPIPTYNEIYYDNYTKFLRFAGGKRRKGLYKKACDEAFYLADYILYPCYNAQDCYFSDWDGYQKIYEDNLEKFVYLPTGCVEKKPQIDKPTIRRETHTENAFVVSYVGRHNESKGYHKLQNIAKAVFDKTDDVKFVICGKEGPLYGLKTPKWVEIGWTKDADSYINASDVFVLPNTQTYFDLVMLEVLSLGKIVIASNTGGNKYFSRFQNIGVFLYNTEEEATDLILKIKNMEQCEIKKLEASNRNLYLNYFDSKIFSKRYEQFYSDVQTGKVKHEY